MRIPLLSIAASAALFAMAGAAAPATPAVPITLVWPAACKVGATCEIQHYIDHDVSAAVKDYACGDRTYDSHDGVDIRLPDLAAEKAGVAVLAAANGTVLRTRDGVADVSVTDIGQAAIKDVECGNGVMIAHGAGFESQYCHMAKGSVIVKPGDTVKAGQPIGRFGLSGDTQFPHLHFTIRQAGQVVDPFAYGAAEGSCNGGRSLWRDTPPYQARVVLNTGFTTGAVSPDAVEAGGAPKPSPDSGFVAYVRAIGLKAGDTPSLVVRGPGDVLVAQGAGKPLPRYQDQYLTYTGRGHAPAGGWPRGRYQATYPVTSGGKTVLTKAFELTL